MSTKISGFGAGSYGVFRVSGPNFRIIFLSPKLNTILGLGPLAQKPVRGKPPKSPIFDGHLFQKQRDFPL